MLLWIAAVFAAGAWTGVELGGSGPPAWAYLLLSAAPALGLARARLLRTRALPSALALFLLLGMFRGALSLPAEIAPLPEPLATSAGSGDEITLHAALLAEPQPYGESTRLPLSVDSVEVDGERLVLNEAVRVDVLSETLLDAGEPLRWFRHGDRYQVTGRLTRLSPDAAQRPPGLSPEASALMWRANVSLTGRDTDAGWRAALAEFRGGLAAGWARVVPAPESGLATALLTGQRGALTPELTERFRSAGLSHLLAISGLHVGIVLVGAFAAADRVLGRRRQLYLLVPLAAVWAYALLSGMAPPVTRAAIMATVYLVARSLGRQRSTLPALGSAAALMLVVDPRLAHELSFQLSFAAVAGIALLEPRLRGPATRAAMALSTGRQPLLTVFHAVARGLAVSLAATVATAPLVGGAFGEVPVWGPLATLIALPAMPVLISSAAIAGLLEPFASALAQVVGVTAWAAAAWVSGTAESFAALPGGVIATPGWSTALSLAWYAALLGWLGRRRITARARGLIAGTDAPTLEKRGVPSWALVAAGLIAALPWLAVMQSSRNELTVTFYETGRGDAILVQTPGGRQVLIDGGQDGTHAASSVGDTLPFWDRQLDAVMLSHPDADHVGGLPAVLDRHDVPVVIKSAEESPSAAFQEWSTRLREMRHAQGLRVIEPTAGLTVELGEMTRLEVLRSGRPENAPADWSRNDSSTVVRVEHGEVSFLLTGDITRRAERRLLQSGRPVVADVLKLPHHGSDTSSSRPFLEAVSPRVVVVTAGTDSRFDHPAPAVVRRMEENLPDVPVLLTRDRGDIEFRTDGKRLTVHSERSAP
ncbi:MAG: DNA internalization-related competence protein ComEC/Rec2 [Chloroflexota bacterium]